MKINLQEVGDSGFNLDFDQSTKDLGPVLSDLVGGMPFKGKVTIFKAGTEGHFDLNGFVKTHIPEQCSRCGLDFDLQVDEKFKEILMPSMPLPKDGKYSKANHFSDLSHQGPSIVEYFGHTFDLGEYLHEVVALGIPYIPAPALDEADNCSLCKIAVKKHSFTFEEKDNDSQRRPPSPFDVLDKLKLN